MVSKIPIANILKRLPAGRQDSPETSDVPWGTFDVPRQTGRQHLDFDTAIKYWRRY